LIIRKYIFLYVFFLSFFLSGRLSLAHEYYFVKRVNDGDTILLEDGQNVRYIGINAPEIDHDNKKAEHFGYKANVFNKKLLTSKKVRLEFDLERYDQYGRLLAYVFLQDGTFVNKVMIEQGCAYFLSRKPNIRYGQVLFKSQRKAMSAKKGIWRNWRKQTDVYSGNKRSKRFHHKTCPFGKKIGKTNRIFFSSRWDAFWKGFAPCKKCISERFR